MFRGLLKYIVTNSGLLPKQYQQVEYIESSGDEYIETNLYFDFSYNFRVIGKVINPDETLRKVVLGTYGVEGVNNFSIEFGGSSNSHPGYFRNFFQCPYSYDSIYSSNAFPSNIVINYDTSYNASNHTVENILSYNNNVVTYSDSVMNESGPSYYPLRFFLDYRPNQSSIQNSIKIGDTKIYKNDSLVMSLIPCYRKSDDEIGMYDLVSGIFYTNQGSGSFIAGPDV